MVSFSTSPSLSSLPEFSRIFTHMYECRRQLLLTKRLSFILLILLLIYSVYLISSNLSKLEVQRHHMKTVPQTLTTNQSKNKRNSNERRNNISNPKRHLGKLVTNLFDDQAYVLKKKLDINNLILFPFEEDNPYADDRILAQMSYVPVQVVEARKSGKVQRKRIQFYHKSGPSLRNISICPVHECDIINGYSGLEKAHLVVFEGGTPVTESVRPKNQLWLIYRIESPKHSNFILLKDQINFTATYNVDATLVTPYYKYVSYEDVEPKDFNKLSKPYQDYAAGKTKMVAWFVSNCVTSSPRMKYAEVLSKYIQVDIYGECGTLHCERHDAECFEMLRKDYKFYLSFENSICQDYITEKFFLNALNNLVIPIAMGAKKSDYLRVAPLNSFIHVDDFNSIKQLADYLHYLNRNTSAYNEYFSWHGQGTFNFNTYTDCRLCMLAHEAENLQGTHWYTNVDEWSKNSCRDRSYT
ncbi:unnamed protein product [Heterobilharzia americana]|nr:unnamed protein product [Heterobilharzia americana]CAH8449872.1 unnamed protein product [Heterobilharzia americana]